jgi:molecular chaperone GrpE
MTRKVDKQTPGADEPSFLDPRAQGEATTVAESQASPVEEDSLRDATSDIAGLQSELEEARQLAVDSQDKHLRVLAEMENFKKRTQRLYLDAAESRQKALYGKLLGVKDNLERALQYGDSSSGNAGESIIEGVRLTEYQLDQLLAQEGVHPIEVLNQPFDPRLSDAIQSVNDPSVPDHTVIQVVRGGYTYNDEVLRPAQVIVSVHGDEE